MYENYLLNPLAIAHVASAIDGSEVAESRQTTRALHARRQDGKYYCSADPSETSDNQPGASPEAGCMNPTPFRLIKSVPPKYPEDARQQRVQGKAGLRWHGWHAFRRGWATNLHRLGVADKTILRILRHADVAVTQNCYIKTLDADAAAAMHHFGRSLQNAPNMHLAGVQRTPGLQVGRSAFHLAVIVLRFVLRRDG